MKNMLLTVTAFCAVTILHAQDAKVDAYRKAYMERDSAKVVQLAAGFLKDYPMAATDPVADKKAGVQYYRIYDRLITTQPKEINKNLARYVNEIPFVSVIDLYYHRVALYNLHKLERADVLVERSSMLLKRIMEFQQKTPAEFSDLSSEQWKEKYDRSYYEILFTHQNLLLHTGKSAEALTFAEKANNGFYHYKSSALNDDHIQILLSLNKKEEAQRVLEAGVKNNQATPRMLQMLKDNYVAKHKSEEGFDAYVGSLKDDKVESEMTAHIKKELINKEVPAFTVYDSNGKEVSSKDWIGKTVVMDFWASWCVPCKAAFPGMQLAKERLANEKDVVFYFVVVHEHKQGYKQEVKKFVEDNKFPFTILFDGFDDDKSSDKAAGILGVVAIPHKMVLDKNGKLRFSMMGYYGSPSQLADEIVMMVNMVK